MRWFYDLKIGTKLIVGFLVVALITGIVGAVGLSSLNTVAQADKLLYEENTLGLHHAGDAALFYQRVRFNAVKMIAVDDASVQETCINNIKTYVAQVDEELKMYEGAL